MGALKPSTATRRAIDAARKDVRWTPAHELTATLAMRVAGLLDKATTPTDVLRLTRELRALVADLPSGAGITPPGPPAPEGSGDEPEPAGPEDPIDRELADIVGSGPTLGHTPYA